MKILRKAAASVEAVEPPKIATAWSQNSALTECGSGIAVTPWVVALGLLRRGCASSGTRQLNCAIHRIAVTELRCHPEAQACLQKRTFTVTVSVHGERVAAAHLHRACSRTALADQAESLRADGFVGEFWHPAITATRRPAILVLGGSEGGLPGVLLPALLAGDGYPALGVAYFGTAGP